MIQFDRQVRTGIAEIEPYVPGLTDDELKKMYGVAEVVKLNANENALGPSALALSAIHHEMQHLHHYPDGSSGELREAIAKFHDVHANYVLVGNGSDDLIKLISETFLEEGDEVVMPFPSFSQYGFGAAIMRAVVKRVPLRADFTYDIEAMVEAVSAKTKLVYLCSPNNPTGTILTQSELEFFLSRLPQNVVVVLDLAYNDYSTHPERVLETPELLNDPRICILHTFSKLYGLAGLRIGYGLGSPSLWAYVNRVREPFNVNRIAQRAGAAALGDERHRSQSRQLAKNSFLQYKGLHAYGYGVTHSEGNFVLVHTGNGLETTKALMKRGIMVRTGFPGLEEYVRITYGLPEENEQCIQALIQLSQVEKSLTS